MLPICLILVEMSGCGNGFPGSIKYCPRSSPGAVLFVIQFGWLPGPLLREGC
ncbi:hypothetical protein BDR22DRAFT_845554 [Usnea florida]